MVLQRGWAAYLRSLQKRPLSTKAAAAAFIFFSSDAATQYVSHVPSAALERRDPAAARSCAASSARTDDNAAIRKVAESREGPVIDHPGFGDAFQFHRSISAACFGVVAATWLHYWWNALELLVAARLPLHGAASRRTRVANALVKVAIDQSLAAPLYTYSYYVVTNFLGSAFAESQRERPLSDRLAGTKHILTETHDKARTMLGPTMLQHYKLWPAVHFVNFYAVPLQHRVLVQNTVLVFWSAYLSHLNHQDQHGNGGLHLMTPNEEVLQAIHRRESREQ